MVYQRWKIAHSLPQSRDADVMRAQPVEEILAELPFTGFLHDVYVGAMDST